MTSNETILLGFYLGDNYAEIPTPVSPGMWNF